MTAAPLTLESIRAAIGGNLVGWPEPDQVITHADLGVESVSVRVMLTDTAADGLLVLAHPKRQHVCENYVRGRLGLPLLAKPANDNVPALPAIDPAAWEGQPVPERLWHVPDVIPANTVTLLSGEGGAGKSQLALQLWASTALSCDWLGMPVTAGPALFYGAEDSADELHRRLDNVLKHYGRKFTDLAGSRLVPMNDRSALLANADRAGKMLPTENFAALQAEVVALKPKLVVLDTSADVYGGDEIKREQVRQFVGMLRAVAIKTECTILLPSHPSLTGINSGSGLSGSTAWNNSVRSRLYLELVKDDEQARELKLKKSNYAQAGAAVKVRWQDGVYTLDTGPDPAVKNLLARKVDKTFLELLALFNEQGQNLSPSPSVTFAPTKMAEHPKAAGFKKRDFTAAQQRLLDAGKVKIETFGKPSRPQKRLVLAA